ncbi:MAG: hypothetical protein CXX72_03155 [Methanobacteriota archaeon]|nr:MAG: hypothetical protein CXX72_03155 [Euryarchaeota archaeon]
MFTKVAVAVDADHPVHSMGDLLDVLHARVDPADDLVVLEGMVADTLESAAPWENVHDKLLIDATSGWEVPSCPGEPVPGKLQNGVEGMGLRRESSSSSSARCAASTKSPTPLSCAPPFWWSRPASTTDPARAPGWRLCGSRRPGRCRSRRAALRGREYSN